MNPYLDLQGEIFIWNVLVMLLHFLTFIHTFYLCWIHFSTTGVNTNTTTYNNYTGGYTRVSNGHNCSRVTSKEECEHAARQLELAGTVASEESISSWPPYCYFASGQTLWFNQNGNSSKKCKPSRVCICKEMPGKVEASVDFIWKMTKLRWNWASARVSRYLFNRSEYHHHHFPPGLYFWCHRMLPKGQPHQWRALCADELERD